MDNPPQDSTPKPSKSRELKSAQSPQDSSIGLLKDVIQFAKYLDWDSEVGKKKAREIADQIHNGKYGDTQGIWVQADNALEQLASLLSNEIKAAVEANQSLTRLITESKIEMLNDLQAPFKQSGDIQAMTRGQIISYFDAQIEELKETL